MSRVGKKILVVPSGVTVTQGAGEIAVKGPKGELKSSLPPLVKLELQPDKTLLATRSSEEPASRAQHGLLRAMVANMITGVTTGFERKLEINGVGYRAEVKGPKLILTLGFSHPIDYDLPKGVAAKVEKNVITLSGIDKPLLGQTAAKLRSFRPPEPYKGKGVKYMEETIRRKVGKAGAA